MNLARAHAWLLLIVLAGLSSCSLFTPSTPVEGVAAVYASVDAAYQTTEARLKAGALTPDQAERIADQLDAARGYADTAKLALKLSDQAGADNALAAAQAILTAVEQELRQ